MMSDQQGVLKETARGGANARDLATKERKKPGAKETVHLQGAGGGLGQ